MVLLPVGHTGAAAEECCEVRPRCGEQALSIINPEELRLPAVRVPDSLDEPSRAAWSALGGLVDVCTCTAANDRPTIE